MRPANLVGLPEPYDCTAFCRCSLSKGVSLGWKTPPSDLF